ncbi:MAG: hypothetical protein ABIY55_00075 [Kofleriaceae bacterium]
MLATVMWNGDFLGEVYRLRASDDGAFRAIVTASHAVLTAPRTERAVSDDGGATTDTGGGSGGRIIPTPHPNV